MFVYQVDTGGPGGVQYSATIEYDCYVQETAWANGSDFSGKNWATYVEFDSEFGCDITADLLADQDVDAGDVDIDCDGTDITISITMQNDWELLGTHLHVGDEAGDVPQKKGNPIPGQFDQKGDETVFVYTVSDPLGPVVIALHAGVQIPESLL